MTRPSSVRSPAASARRVAKARRLHRKPLLRLSPKHKRRLQLQRNRVAIASLVLTVASATTALSAMIAPSVANAVSRTVPNALPSAAANPLSVLCVKVEATATMAVTTVMARRTEMEITAVSARTALIVPSARLSVVKLLLLLRIQLLLLLRLHPRQKLQ